MPLAPDLFFAETYNQKVLHRLKRRFGAFRSQHVDLAIASEVMLDMMHKMQAKPRRGEVVMVVPNEQGHVWLHTKTFYPAGVYRLMTGGLEPGERPDEAFLREVAEETGFQATIERCLAVITYSLRADDDVLPFVSYVFMTAPTSGRPRPDDSGEAIADFRAVPPEALPDVARHLRSLSGPFADWGIFRAVAHEITYTALKE